MTTLEKFEACFKHLESMVKIYDGGTKMYDYIH